ncbi:hypothetical protein ACQ4PT_018949 [Festuca glaucescens]
MVVIISFREQKGAHLLHNQHHLILFLWISRTPALFPELTKLLGIEERHCDIVNWLVDEDIPQLLAISIVGFGGLGKTTLAMTAYQTASASFQCRAFVTVSQKFDVKAIIRDIL